MQSETHALCHLGQLTHASELQGRAAQLEGVPDQADLGTVQVRAIQVKVLQQPLDASRDAPAGNPVHAACGGEETLWGHMPPSSSYWEAGSHTSLFLWGFSASALSVFGAVHCRMRSGTPDLHPPDASSTSPVMIIKNMNIAKSPLGENHPWLRITEMNRWTDRRVERWMDKWMDGYIGDDRWLDIKMKDDGNDRETDRDSI